MNKRSFINRGSFGCAFGLAIMSGAVLMGMVIFIKCFGTAYKADYTLAQYISALFTRHALIWYLGASGVFAAGLWLTINAMISIIKDFFEV